VKTILAIAIALLPAIAAAQFATDHVRAEATTPDLFMSGAVGYSFDDNGSAVLIAEKVTNNRTSATGPLRLILLLRSLNYPYFNVFSASYPFADSLAAGASIANVRGIVQFNQPPNGCYTPTVVLEELVGGDGYTARDSVQFFRSADFGNGCIASFVASPAYVTPGGTSTLTWSTLGSVDSVMIDNGVGTQPANAWVSVAPGATVTYTLTANGTANTPPPAKSVTVTVGPPLPPRRRAVGR
jgi:hypothetical protein